MDRFDRCVAWFMTAVALGGGALLIIQGWRSSARAEIVVATCVSLLLARWPWITISAQSRNAAILASICADNTGPSNRFCTLEPGHPGDHRYYHSSGGCIGWPRKGGA